MIALLACCAALANQSPVTTESRVAFRKAAAAIDYEWSKERILKALGPPDSKEEWFDPYHGEAWEYGTDGPGTLATLGTVSFIDGEFNSVSGWDGPPPPASLISEQELRDALQFLHRNRMKDNRPVDSLRLIRMANMLIGKGQEKAMAILREFSGLWGGEYLFWLVRSAFTSTAADGIFAVPSIGMARSEKPLDLKSWPTYPLLIVDDVPISLYQRGSVGGGIEQFGQHFQCYASTWKLRTNFLVPPSDPFLLYEELQRSPQWPKDVTEWEQERLQQMARDSILHLVQNSVRPEKPFTMSKPSREEDLVRLHQEFAAAGARWDVGRQMYIHADGSFKPDLADVVYPKVIVDAFKVPKLELKVVLSRDEWDLIHYGMRLKETGTGQIGVALLLFEDPETGKELHWACVNGEELWDRKVALAEPPHDVGHSMYRASGFKFEHGQKLRMTVLLDGKRYESSVVAP